MTMFHLFQKSKLFRGIKSRRIYLDYAATTPVDPRVTDAMQPFARDIFGNPSSIHKEGVAAGEALKRARKEAAQALRVRSEEIIFTSGGTEANNLAIHGVIEALRKKGKNSYHNMHVITSNVEHVSVLESMQALERDSVSVTYIGVDQEGKINPEEVIKALRPETILVSLMYVNNEIGTITPLREISKKIQESWPNLGQGQHFPLFHTDASQAPLFLDCAPERLGVDLLTIDAQKIYGPKGVGLLFKKHGITLESIFYGGGQEDGLRSGTEPLALIAGLSKALILATEAHEYNETHARDLQKYFLKLVEDLLPEAELNGSLTNRIANNINLSFPGINGEFLVVQLDQKGIAVSTASACLRDKEDGSYVVAALGKGEKYASSAIRFTFGKDTTKQDVRIVVATLRELLKS